MNAIAEAAGVTVMMGNMGESTLGLAAHFHVNVALANATHCDADLPWRPAGLQRDIGCGLSAELRDGVSTPQFKPFPVRTPLNSLQRRLYMPNR